MSTSSKTSGQMGASNSQPMVSVVIAVFNGAPYIQRALTSVLDQTFKNFEIIVIDDGSTDNLREILGPYINDKSIRYFYQENRGLAGARNLGIKMSRGDFIKFLDSDDLIYPRLLELQTEDLLKNNADISLSDYELLFPDGTNKAFKKEGRIPRLDDFILYDTFGPTHSYLLRRNIFVAAGGFDESLTAKEDGDLWLRLVLKGARVSVIDYLGCGYTIWAGSMSSRSDRMLTNTCKVFEKLSQALMPDFNSLSSGTKDALYRRGMNITHQCIAHKQNVSILLPHTLRLLERLIQHSVRGVKLFLLRSLGIKLYVRLIYVKYCLRARDYHERIKSYETSFRSSALQELLKL